MQTPATSRFVITDFGAIADGQTLSTAAIQQAIDACHANGGGQVVVPAGQTFLTGTVTLKSRVELHVETGARLLGSANIEDFPSTDLRCLIEGRDAEDVALTGLGTIDGQSQKFVVRDLQYIWEPVGYAKRPRLVGFQNCRRVTISQLTLSNSVNWTLHMIGCENVDIHNLRILNDLKFLNCDGINPDHCRNVRIANCHIEAGDDCIVLKTTKEHTHLGPTENITVTNCVLVSTSAALKIGTESVCDFRNIVFSNCVIRNSSRGLAIQLRDQGNVENVIFSNMIVETRLFEDHWWGKAEPIYVTAIHRFASEKDPSVLPPWNPTGALGRVRNIRFSNILCRGENGLFIAGSPDSPIEDLVLDDIRVEVNKSSKWPGGRHDRRPCDALGPSFRDPTKDPGLTEHPTSGVFIEHARDITLRDVRVHWGENRPPYYRHALHARHVDGLALDRFRGEAAHPSQFAALELEHTTRA
jgi:hypothetical protein